MKWWSELVWVGNTIEPRWFGMIETFGYVVFYAAFFVAVTYLVTKPFR